jgi:uncharacterized protein YggE
MFRSTNRIRISRSVAIIALTALLLTACATTAPGVQSSGDLLRDTITVTGFGEASGTPDLATVQLGVSVLDADVSEAIAQSNATIGDITQALIATGVLEEDIQTTNFNVWPDDRFDPETGFPTGERTFRVESTLQVKVHGIENVGDVIQAALDAGANNVYGLSFSIDDPSALISEARAAAIEDAKERAGEIAEELDFQLVEAIIIAESSGGVIPLYAGLGAMEAAVGGGPPISPGESTVTAQISITFAISR